ncbi:protein-(glutamine-N5) methyltransferase, release factor-specific [Mucilaginibacter sp. PPCGB 2223]|uniref:peptide chain release factor N(5)-glutamine methyltransferase n=1 Tax=Mucilaginibacter sp. PPCGB 2223 TaxID=1886027 RepID=UPI00082476FF|nr:peptide chain release factor N(5)-glutamine methyltransferase [Mucilaginibacter sp. PPCGB 2223]OCX53426.1 protein-(glutamine-N5) methyltransferase, release factor-specific [Mucilaginibacter sp. PPCGB 2223]
MKTIANALSFFENRLKFVYNADELNTVKYLVLSDLFNLSKAQLRAFTDRELNNEQWQLLEQIIAELKTGKPVQYVLGHTEFYGLPFKVNSSVLIPRPETEELVEWILSESKKLKIKSQNDLHILDIGTGSGCIPITLKKYLPDADVNGLDISPAALKTAQLNAQLNEVDVKFIEGDILNPNMARSNSSKTGGFELYDIIVSNPPYVTEHEKGEMKDNVLSFEPHLALFVPDNDPLVFYTAIADFALKKLQPGGLLFFEINENLGKQTVEILYHKLLKNIELRKDMRGKDRMIKAQK